MIDSDFGGTWFCPSFDSEYVDEKAEIMATSIESGKYDKRSKECFKCGKLRYFARECRSGGGNKNTNDKNNRYQRPGNDKGKIGRKRHNCGNPKIRKKIAGK